MSTTTRAALLVAAYLCAIVAANLLVAAYGPAVTVLNALVFIALNLATRDALHTLWGRHVARNMLALILLAGALSWVLNGASGRIALASAAAFIISEAADAVVFSTLSGRGYLTRSNASNVIGAALDSVLFSALAFGVLAWPVVLGQFAAKVLGGAAWAWTLRGWLARRAPAAT